ncbi:hypothetical protein Golomagni_05905 [Golovinomyces magnicellulatus]|nr:hypothetical protein Golomagni_05905 [Golovinomyces magnicellulatus]
MADNDSPVTLRTRKFIRNPLLGRKQFVVLGIGQCIISNSNLSVVFLDAHGTQSTPACLNFGKPSRIVPDETQPPRHALLTLDSSDVLHPGRANISKDELREKLAGMYKAQKDQVSTFGLRTQFGGGKTTGFALVYDSPEAMKKFEPRYRLVRVDMATKVEKASRQQRKQRKNKLLTLRGTAKVKGAKAKKEK